MSVRIRLRRDTAANWTAVNPILSVGEVGLETDTKKFKVGDGVTSWTGLGYWASGGGGSFTGGISGGNTAGNTGTVTNQIVFAGGNNITLSGSTNGAGMTVTVSGAAGGGAGYTAGVSTGGNTLGNSGVVTGQLVLAGGNNVTLSGSTNAGSMTITVSVPNTVAQTNQTLGIYGSSQTTGQSSSSTHDARSLSLVGAGAVSVGWSGGSLLVSAPNTIAQTNQSAGIYLSSQTTGQSSSSTYDARSLTVVGQGIISVGWSNSSLLISATAAGGGGGFTGGVSTGGNTLGNTGTQTGQFVLAGGNNITLSVGTAAGGAQTITVSGPNTVAQSNQTGNIYGSSQTTGQSSSSSYDHRTLTIVGMGANSVGWSAGSLLISAPNTIAQTNQVLSLYASLNTTIGTSMTVDARSLTFSGGGAASVGFSTSAGGSSLIFSAPVQTNQTVGLYHTGNTTGQSSSSTVDARSMSFSGLGIASVGMSAGMVLISVPSGGGAAGTNTLGLSNIGNTSGNTVPATGSAIQMILAGGNNITLSGSTNGSSVTITVSGPNTVAQTNQTGNIYGSSQTTGQSSSSSYDHRSLSLVGMGAVSVGWSNSSLLISAPNTVAQTSNAFSAGAASSTFQTLSFQDTNNVSFSNNAGQIRITHALAGTSTGFAGANISGSITHNSSGINLSLSVAAPGAAAENNWFNLLGANTAGNTTASGSTIGLSGLGVTLSGTNGSVIVVSGGGGGAAYTGSFFEPEVYGGTTTQTYANGTVYFRPFYLNGYLTVDRIGLLAQATSQSATTMSHTGSVSGAVATSGTGQWSMSGTVLMFSRKGTGTNASSSQLVSFQSDTYSYAVGYSNSVSQSTNASSATVSWSTKAGISYISQIDSAGGVTTTASTSSGSGSFSSTSTNGQTFSSSYAGSFASLHLSQVRPQMVGAGYTLSPGEYWLANIVSTASASTNYSLQRLCLMNSMGFVHYTTNTSGYMEIGNSASIASSNIKWGLGSYSASSQTSTTIPISQISAMSNYSLYFYMLGQTL